MRPSLRAFAFLGITALAVLAVLWGTRDSPVERAAAGLLGERWYRVTLHGDPVGAFVSRGKRGREGYRFETELRFRLGSGAEVHIVDTMDFDAAPDHRLQAATHQFASGETSVHTALERRGEVLEAVVDGRRSPLDWDYRLSDYVMLEAWLSRERGPRARALTRSLDLAELRIEREIWQVVERNATGYRLRQASAAGHTEVQLDAGLVPLSFDLAGVFSMKRVAGADEASAWREAPPADLQERHAGPVDVPLTTPHALTQLTLRVHAEGDTEPDADFGSWPALSPDGDAGWILVAGGGADRTVESGEASEWSRATPSLPASDPAMRRLADRAMLGMESPHEQVDALVDFVHAYVEYAEVEGVQTVAETVRSRRGDCTEYADLLTTLARARGITAPTGTGLANAPQTPAIA
ncbi:MAG: transglutaminase domain-containing protein, partial [Gammaproteobacteria bacterium]|nr:transglutaminase domain-containing protein [Gammaproteobacteria bacterium]